MRSFINKTSPAKDFGNVWQLSGVRCTAHYAMGLWGWRVKHMASRVPRIKLQVSAGGVTSLVLIMKLQTDLELHNKHQGGPQPLALTCTIILSTSRATSTELCVPLHVSNTTSVVF